MDKAFGFDADDLGREFRWVHREALRRTFAEERQPTVTILEVDASRGVRVEIRTAPSIVVGAIWVTSSDARNKRKSGEWSLVAPRIDLVPTIRVVPPSPTRDME